MTIRGNKHIVTIANHFTKYLGYHPIPDNRGETVTEDLRSNWICGCGRQPSAFLSDHGSDFENSVMTAPCPIMRVELNFIKGNCLRENGVTERANGTTVVPADGIES